jgi:uncharacterized protein with GYD domain
MPKYLVEARYTTEGAKGLAREGGSGRREAVQKTLKGQGPVRSYKIFQRHSTRSTL